MVQKATERLNYFYLAHGLMSLDCLKGLVKARRMPDFVVIHVDRERDKLDSEFFFPLIEFCDKHGLKIIEVNKIAEVKSELVKCKIGLCGGFMEILKKEIYSLPEYGILNLHCGKLPAYRGRAPISRTIMNGDKNLVMSIHQIDEGVDSGDLLIEKNVKIEVSDDVNSIYRKCSEKSGELFVKALEVIESGKYKYTPQERTSETPYKTFKLEERKILWSDGVVNSCNKMRALYPPYPQSFFEFNGKKFFVNRARFVSANTKKVKFAEVKGLKDNRVLLGLADGELVIINMEDSNRKELLPLKEFKIGDKIYDH